MFDYITSKLEEIELSDAFILQLYLLYQTNNILKNKLMLLYLIILKVR